MALFIDHIYTLFLVLAFALVTVGLGRVILARLGVQCLSHGEMVLLGFGIGVGGFSLSVFALSSLQLLSRASLLAMTALYTALGAVGWAKAKGLIESSGPKATNAFGKELWDRWLLAVVGACLILGLLLVLTPAIGKDAFIYHLAIPKLFLKHGGFYFVEGNIFAHYPLGQEMIYILALALKGEVMAKGIHFLLALMLLLGMWQFGRHVIPGVRFISLALLIFITIPSVFTVSHLAYNDLAVSLFFFLTVYAFIGWFRSRGRPWLLLCGIFVGLASGMKYTALFLPFLMILGIAWRSRYHGKTWQDAGKSMVLFMVTAMVVGCPFYIRNWSVTGNPFYPFMFGIFGGRGMDPEQAHLYDLFVQSLGMGRRWSDFLLLPWNVSIHAQPDSPRFDGFVGPIFLLVLPFAFGIRKMAVEIKLLLVYSVLIFFFWATSAQQIRYLIPAFPVLALVVGYILSAYRKRKVFFTVLAVVVVGCVGVNMVHVVKEFRRISPMGVITGEEEKEAFMKRMHPLYEMYDTVNNLLPQKAHVFLVYMKNFSYLCDRSCYSDSMFEAYTLKKVLSLSNSGKETSLSLKEKGFSHMMYDDIYVTGPMTPLTTEELQRFSEFRRHFTETLKELHGRYYLCRFL